MKTWISIMAAVVLMTGCGGGAGKTEERDQAGLYERGLALVNKMDSMAESPAYQKIMGGSDDLTAVMEEIGAQDYSNPKAVYQVSLSGETIDLLLELLGGGPLTDELSPELRKELEYRISAVIPNKISAMAGVESLAAAGLLGTSDHFIDGSLTEPVVYFYLYDGDYCGAVTFSPCEEGIVHASGLMMKNEILGQLTEDEEIMQWLSDQGGLQLKDVSRVAP